MKYPEVVENFILFILSTVYNECKGTPPFNKTVCEVAIYGCYTLSMNWSLFNWHTAIRIISGLYRFCSFENG